MALPANDYELQRQRRIMENNKKLEELGLLRQTTILESFAPKKKAPQNNASKPPRPYQPRLNRKVQLEPRRSKRITGEAIDYCEIDEHDGCVRVRGRDSNDNSFAAGELLDLMDRNNRSVRELEPEKQEQLQQIRCSSQGRGSLYDSAIGITCHFCRQKKLCGEPDCPRCQYRDANADCIGKTDCSKCHSANGRFCRACLLIRYGYELEEVRQQDNWLCPHCFEDECPDEGIICNSSICMKRRGLKPTGIAIYDAQAAGFKSVAQLLQSQLKKMGGVSALRKAAEGGEDVSGKEVAGVSKDELIEGPITEQAAAAAVFVPAPPEPSGRGQVEDQVELPPRRRGRPVASSAIQVSSGRVSKAQPVPCSKSTKASAITEGGESLGARRSTRSRS